MIIRPSKSSHFSKNMQIYWIFIVYCKLQVLYFCTCLVSKNKRYDIWKTWKHSENQSENYPWCSPMLINVQDVDPHFYELCFAGFSGNFVKPFRLPVFKIMWNACFSRTLQDTLKHLQRVFGRSSVRPGHSETNF